MLPQIVKGVQYLSILVFVVVLLTFLFTGASPSRFVAMLWTSLGVGLMYGVTEGLLTRWDN